MWSVLISMLLLVLSVRSWSRWGIMSMLGWQSHGYMTVQCQLSCTWLSCGLLHSFQGKVFELKIAAHHQVYDPILFFLVFINWHWFECSMESSLTHRILCCKVEYWHDCTVERMVSSRTNYLLISFFSPYTHNIQFGKLNCTWSVLSACVCYRHFVAGWLY